jgi:UTP--glucose-1-phosphate uridylyltransferase
MIPLLILAAGNGSRMFPAAYGVPKELFPIGNRPGIQIVLEEAKAANIKDIACVISPCKDSIKKYLLYNHSESGYLFNDQEIARLDCLDSFNRHFNYSFVVQDLREKKTDGIGYAILCAADKIESNGYFCMAYPDDIFFDVSCGLAEMLKLYDKYKMPIIAVEEIDVSRSSSYGIVSLDAKINDNAYMISGIVEKPDPTFSPSTFGVVGRHLLSTEIFELMRLQKKQEPCFTVALNELISRRGMIAMVLNTPRYDIGNIAGYKKAIAALA